MSCEDNYAVFNWKYPTALPYTDYSFKWPPTNLTDLTKKEIMSEPNPKFERSIDITDSDWVEKIWYDVNTLTLDMKTHNGKRYRYPNINPATFARIVTAESVGKAVNKELRELNHTTV